MAKEHRGVTRTVEHVERITYTMDLESVRRAIIDAIDVVFDKRSVFTIEPDGSARIVSEYVVKPEAR